MRNLPAVSQPVDVSRFQTISKWALIFWMALIQLGWWIQSPELTWPQAIAFALGIFLTILIGYETSHAVRGVLRWTGETWHLDCGALSLEGKVIPCLDFQSRMLLSFHGPQKTLMWLWLESGEDRQQWRSIRRALWSIRHEIRPASRAIPDSP